MLFALMMVLIPVVVPNVSWGMTDAEAINVSGRQRMLSQRMMKNYLMLGADVKAAEAQRQLDSAVALFESQFLSLRDYAPTDVINKRLDAVEALWLPHREAILAAPNRDDAVPLMQENLSLLKACDDVVKAIEAHSGIASGYLVNISGRQRMLSQKIAKAYLAIYWRVEDPRLEEEFNAAIDLFEGALEELEAADDNTVALEVALNRVRNQWRFSQSGFKLGSDGRYVPTVISVTTESILKKMDDITGQYAAVMQRQQMVASGE